MDELCLTVTCRRGHEWDAYGIEIPGGFRLTEHKLCPTCYDAGLPTQIRVVVERESLA